MKYASYRLTGDERIPAVVSIGDSETPVWMQQLWDEGEWAEFIVRNGCGHCSCAMALCLFGVDIDPHAEYSLCRELWGEPEKEGEHRQGNFQSIVGIVKILTRFGVPARCFGVPDRDAAASHIESALREGKQVIFESHPTEDFPDNPFSTGEHWVMAVGYTENGEILIANSSLRAVKTGIQLVDIDTVRRALYLGSSPEDMTWGEWRDEFKHGTGYIVVG